MSGHGRFRRGRVPFPPYCASSRQDRPSPFRILPPRRRPRVSPKGRTLRRVRMIAAGIRVTWGARGVGKAVAMA